MSPIKHVKSGTSGYTYQTPFVGPVNHTVAIEVDLTQFSDDEIDADGYLKPGIPLDKAGALVGASPAHVFGVTIEEVKVAANNLAPTIAALDTQHIAVATICMVNRKVVEDTLGRALTADEIAGFDRAGSKCVLIPFEA